MINELRFDGVPLKTNQKKNTSFYIKLNSISICYLGAMLTGIIREFGEVEGTVSSLKELVMSLQKLFSH